LLGSSAKSVLERQIEFIRIYLEIEFDENQLIEIFEERFIVIISQMEAVGGEDKIRQIGSN
jgi:hypothetical protein